jgi:hypothetical protein
MPSEEKTAHTFWRLMAEFKLRFINSEGLVSAGINWVTNSLWDHVEVETPEGTYIGAHANSGIQERPAGYCKPTRERRYSIPCTDEQLAKSLAYARAKIGTPYDYKDILGLFLHDRRLNSKSREICSAFAFDVAWAGGIMMLNCLPGFRYLITPETLHLSSLLIGHCTYKYPEA